VVLVVTLVVTTRTILTMTPTISVPTLSGWDQSMSSTIGG
jgi:hypothetical protein